MLVIGKHLYGNSERIAYSMKKASPRTPYVFYAPARVLRCPKHYSKSWRFKSSELSVAISKQCFRPEKRSTKINFWGSGDCWVGRGVFHSKGWWSKTSWPSLESFPWILREGPWNVPGILGRSHLLGFTKRGFVFGKRGLFRKVHF